MSHETINLTFRDVTVRGLTVEGGERSPVIIPWELLDEAADRTEGREETAKVYQKLRDDSAAARKAAIEDEEAAESVRAERRERARAVREAKAAGLTYVPPTKSPDYVAARNQGQIVLVGASVCERVDGGYVAIGHTFDQSDLSTTVWKVGRGFRTFALARTEALDIAERA